MTVGELADAHDRASPDEFGGLECHLFAAALRLAEGVDADEHSWSNVAAYRAARAAWLKHDDGDPRLDGIITKLKES